MTINTLYELVRHSVETFASRIAYSMFDGEDVTYAEAGRRIAKVQDILVSSGLRPGDKVALLSSNMPNWGICYFAVTSAGMVVVPILPDFSSEELDMIIEHSEARALLVSDRLFTKLSRQTIDRLKAEKLQLQHQQFRGTRIYKKIHALTRQDTADRKAWKVLSPDERTELRRTVDGIYADYIAHLQTLYSPLTEDDRLYCCLAAAGLDTQTIALCFGYTDTHTINQRKLRLKARYIGPKA